MRTERGSSKRAWVGKFVAGFLAFLLTAARADAAPVQRITQDGCKIDVERELWIKHLSVVEDPARTTWVAEPDDASEGAWSFGRLMSNISGMKDPAPFVLDLFDQFRTTQVVNGFEVPPHPITLGQVIDPWIAASQASGLELDFSIAPFRLNGIVNRLDLRTNATTGRATSAGEGRIIFTVLDPDGSPSVFTFILEYELLADDCDDVKAWAQAWHALGSIPFGSAYNEALEKLVNRFAGPNVAPGRPNGSALLQARTNEFLRKRPGGGFGDDFWQWREFQLSPLTGMLVQTTTAQTVDTSHNRTPLLRDFINENEAAILDGTLEIPLTYQGLPFRSAASNGEPFVAFLRAAGIRNNEARHLVSLNTCVSCHSEETGTDFFHSTPRVEGYETLLSGFLTGITVTDPVDPSVTRTFDDLDRRVADLCGVLDDPCSLIALEKPLPRVH